MIDFVDVCSLPYDEGPCRGSILKWRFDVDTGKCLKFAYGGCDGNGNRFGSKEECESLCRQETKSPAAGKWIFYTFD